MLDPESIASLVKIAASCRSRGAREVLLGYPTHDRYEFIGNDGRYAGRICPSFINNLFRSLNSGQVIAETGLWCGACRISGGFYIFLSWPAPSPVKKEPRVSIARGSDASKVLLVEDDPHFANLLRALLKAQNITSTVLRSAEEALPIASDVSLIICDLHLPGMSGLELLTKLRAQGNNLQFVILTNEQDQRYEQALACAGADLVLKKAASPELILSWCSSALKRALSR